MRRFLARCNDDQEVHVIIDFQTLLTGMQVIAEATVGRPDLGNAAWIGITAVIVVVAYGVAVAVPNIWPVMVRVFCCLS